MQNPMALAGFFGLGQVAGPSRYVRSPFAPVGSERTLPGYPYGMRGFGQADVNPAAVVVSPSYPVPGPASYPPAPVPAGLPANQYWAAPPYFSHTMGYKDALAAAGLEFHTEVFDLFIDPIAQSGQALAPGASVIATARISQEADFVAEKQVAIVSADAGAPFFTMQVFDNATNRALSNIPVRSELTCGTAQLPRLMKPRLFRRNSDISVVFTNTSAVTIRALQMGWSGFKVFDPSALNLNSPQ